MQYLWIIITLLAAFGLAAPGRNPKIATPNARRLASKGTNPKIAALDARRLAPPGSNPKDPFPNPQLASPEGSGGPKVEPIHAPPPPAGYASLWTPLPHWTPRILRVALRGTNPKNASPKAHSVYPRGTNPKTAVHIFESPVVARRGTNPKATSPNTQSMSARGTNPKADTPNSHSHLVSPRGTNPKVGAPKSHLLSPRGTNPKITSLNSRSVSPRGGTNPKAESPNAKWLETESPGEYLSSRGTNPKSGSPKSHAMSSRGTNPTIESPSVQLLDDDDPSIHLEARGTNPKMASPKPRLVSSRGTDPESKLPQVQGLEDEASWPDSHLMFSRGTNPKAESPRSQLVEDDAPGILASRGTNPKIASPNSHVMTSRGTNSKAKSPTARMHEDNGDAPEVLRARGANPKIASPNSHRASPRGTNPKPPGSLIFKLHSRADVDSVARVMEALGGRVRRRLDYSAFKAVSADLPSQDAVEQVTKMPSVTGTWPIKEERSSTDWLRRASTGADNAKELTKRQLPVVSLGDERSANVTLTSHIASQVDKLHARGLTGKGFTIAIVDSSVAWAHTALGGCVGAGCVAHFGNVHNGTVPAPRDANDHGPAANLSDIVLAQADTHPLGYSGVAPGAKVRLYAPSRNRRHTLYLDDVLDGIYRAYGDGADIIVVSNHASQGGWPQSPFAAAVADLAARGVVVIVGAGDGGQQGMFSQSDPSAAAGAISVGTMGNSVQASVAEAGEARYVVSRPDDLSPHEVAFDYFPTRYMYNREFRSTPKKVYSTVRHDALAGDACEPLPETTPDLRNKIVLVPTGGCDVLVKVRHVASKGAEAVLLYPGSEAPLPTRLDLSEEDDTLPTIGMVKSCTAEDIINAIKTGSRVDVTLPDPGKPTRWVYFTQPVEAAISDKTSWGPSWDLGLKPQLLAVGESILTATPTGYSLRSGSALAAAFVAGAVALLGEARGSLDPAVVQSLLVSNSQPQPLRTANGFMPYLAPVAQQGGGLLRAYDAAYCTTILTPSSLNFNDTESDVRGIDFVIQNGATIEVVYTLAHFPALTAYAFHSDGQLDGFPKRGPETVPSFARLFLNHTTVTVPAGKSVTVRVMASDPKGLDASRLPVWSGYISINGSDGSSLFLPYQGIAGSIRKRRVLSADSVDLWEGGVNRGQSSGLVATFSRSGDLFRKPSGYDFGFAITPDAGISQIQAYVAAVPSGPGHATSQPNSTAHTAPTERQLHGFPQFWKPKDVNFFTWDGMLDSGEYVPEGEYKFVVRALRIFGHADDARDWDTSDSAPFHVKYNST